MIRYACFCERINDEVDLLFRKGFSRVIFYVDVTTSPVNGSKPEQIRWNPQPLATQEQHMPKPLQAPQPFEYSGLFSGSLHMFLENLPCLFFAVNNLIDTQSVTFKTLGQLIMAMMTYRHAGELNLSPQLARQTWIDLEAGTL